MDQSAPVVKSWLSTGFILVWTAGSRGSALVARKAELHDVEEFAPARVDLDLAVVKQVVSATDSRSNLLAPTEVDVGKTLRIECRVMFVVEPNAGIDGKAAI